MADEMLAQISKTSHDLRNALAVIYSNAQLLQLMLEGKHAEEASVALELTNSVESMQVLLAQNVETLKDIHSKLRDSA